MPDSPLECCFSDLPCLPALDEFVDCECIHTSQKSDSIGWLGAGLVYEGLAERVMTIDQEFVPGVQSVQIFYGGDSGGFAVFAAVAVFAGEDQIPDSVEVDLCSVTLKRMGEEVVYVTERVIFAF